MEGCEREMGKPYTSPETESGERGGTVGVTFRGGKDGGKENERNFYRAASA